MTSIKIAIADDQVLFVKGLRLLLSNYPEMDLIIEAQNGKELLEAIQVEQPHVILMDLQMPVMDGVEATEKVKTLYPDIKIILLTMHEEDHLINHMMKIGANAYLLKNEEPEVLKAAIHAVIEKDFYFKDYVSKALLQGLNKAPKEIKPWSKGPVQLSTREIEILQLICQERTSAEIAKTLFLSNRTIENHRKNMMEKLGVRNTAGLVIYAFKNGIIK